MHRNVTVIDPLGTETVARLLESVGCEDYDLLDDLEPWKAGLLGDDLLIYDGLLERDGPFGLRAHDVRDVEALLLVVPPQRRAAAIAAGFASEQIVSPPFDLTTLAARLDTARRAAPVEELPAVGNVVRFARA